MRLHKVTYNKYKRNAAQYIAALTESEKQQAIEWYADAHKEALNLATIFAGKYPLASIVKVIAVLSPGIQWEVNKRAAFCLLNNHAYNAGMTVAGYGQNVAKAMAILDGAQDLLPSAQKTYAFYKNILTAGQNDGVTIDRHAFKALNNISKGGSVAITKKQYDQLELGYRQLADDYELTPPQMQALVWVGYKKVNNR